MRLYETHTSSVAWQAFTIATTVYEPAQSTYTVLVMHGAGGSSQERSSGIAKALAARGCRAITFDFVSHGMSTGKVSDLTLARRADQALTVFQHFSLKPNTILAGMSMSGQTAIDLMSLLGGQVAGLALLAPAAYDRATRNAPFGPAFTAYLHRHESWRDSDAMEKLRAYHGNVVLFESLTDTIIPKGVSTLLSEAARGAHSFLHLELATVPHQMGRWAAAHPDGAGWFADVILSSAGGQPNPYLDRAAAAGITVHVVAA